MIHPPWCDRPEEDHGVHEARVGAALASDTVLHVTLLQVLDLPAQVLLTREAGVDSTLTPLTTDQLEELRGLLDEARALLN